MMAFVGTNKEKYLYHNTLLCLLRSLQNKNVTIDLRNDTYVCGIVNAVDGFMNVKLNDAIYCDPQGNEYKLEQLYVKSRNIRYVHIPESISIISAIKEELYRPKLKLDNTEPIKKSRKQQKALSKHMQTVASL